MSVTFIPTFLSLSSNTVFPSYLIPGNLVKTAVGCEGGGKGEKKGGREFWVAISLGLDVVCMGGRFYILETHIIISTTAFSPNNCEGKRQLSYIFLFIHVISDAHLSRNS